MTDEAIDRITMKRLAADMAGCNSQLSELAAGKMRDAQTPMWRETRRQTLVTLMSLRDDALRHPDEYMGRTGEPDVLLWLGKHHAAVPRYDEEVAILGR